MDKLYSFIMQKKENMLSVITAEKEREAQREDAYSYSQLKNHLCMKNAQRIIIIACAAFIMGIILLFTNGNISQSSAFRMLGAFMLMASAGVFVWLICREIIKKNPEYRLLRIFSYCYWILFSVSGIIVCLSEYLAGNQPYVFAFFAVVIAAVPIVSIYESLYFAAVTVIPAVIYGFVEKCGIVYFVTVLSALIVYIWIAAIVRSYYASLWIGQKKLVTVEERCSQVMQKDALTGMLNKSGLKAKIAESDSLGRKMVVALINIDNFRTYNHMYGYDNSDRCLYSICNCIRIISKPYTDIISRFGGDEFVIVFEDMSEIDVVKVAEQLRQSVETMAQPFGKGIVTISIGVSGSRTVDTNSYSELLKEADVQLSIAKNSGRNCIGFMGKPFIHENRKSTAVK